MPFATGLCLLFIGLKLTDHIDWSWFFVLLPQIAVTLHVMYEVLQAEKNKK